MHSKCPADHRSLQFLIFVSDLTFPYIFLKSLMHPGSLQISRFGRRGFVLYFMSLQASINCRWNCCYTFYCHFKSPILIKYFVPKHPAHERHPCMEYSPKITGWNKNQTHFQQKNSALFCSLIGTLGNKQFSVVFEPHYFQMDPVVVW